MRSVPAETMSKLYTRAGSKVSVAHKRACQKLEQLTLSSPALSLNARYLEELLFRLPVKLIYMTGETGEARRVRFL